MSSSSNINSILSQSTAIKEIHNVRKQSLELNQQYVAQHAEIRKEEDKRKVLESNAGGHVEIGNENERNKMKSKNQEKTNSSKDTAENESKPSDEHIIDITV
ncbi:MAG: hypothetical protein FP814_13825 [Desulfobacterium sp.]|nr:hypothetical protein [Desulfobacterium sp.]MBU3948923.1 hypothetical protein [Pseudomonadota bacterium]MBU4010750.1 hypothetical protein [Pseudomonadota bacterium]MBU4035951.1 hypothetical protein [Pseudomonadota bacterium]